MDTGTFAQNQGMSSATTPCVGPGCGSSAPDVSSFTNYRANPNLPTLEEIKFLYSIKKAINTLFSYLGGTPLDKIYWTSTAYGGGLMYTCSFQTGICNNGSKDNKRAVFAVYKF